MNPHKGRLDGNTSQYSLATAKHYSMSHTDNEQSAVASTIQGHLSTTWNSIARKALTEESSHLCRSSSGLGFALYVLSLSLEQYWVASAIPKATSRVLGQLNSNMWAKRTLRASSLGNMEWTRRECSRNGSWPRTTITSTEMARCEVKLILVSTLQASGLRHWCKRLLCSAGHRLGVYLTAAYRVRCTRGDLSRVLSV